MNYEHKTYGTYRFHVEGGEYSIGELQSVLDAAKIAKETADKVIQKSMEPVKVAGPETWKDYSKWPVGHVAYSKSFAECPNCVLARHRGEGGFTVRSVDGTMSISIRSTAERR